MKPSKETIEEFQRKYFEVFGEEISHQEAYERFSRLTDVLRILLGIPPDDIDDESENDRLNNYQ